MNADELRERILRQGGEPVDNELLWQLRGLPSVHWASSSWFHGWVEIRVQLAEWTYDAQAEASALIDAFAREHVANFSVTTRFVPPPLAPPWVGTVLESCIREVALGRIASHSSVTAEMVAEWRRLNPGRAAR